MLSSKELIDNAVLNLKIGDNIEIKCSIKEANSLRVRLHRELEKLRKFNSTLADSFWVSKTMVDKITALVTLGRGVGNSMQSNMIIKRADGSEEKYTPLEGITDDEYDTKRMEELMKKDGISPDTQERILKS